MRDVRPAVAWYEAALSPLGALLVVQLLFGLLPVAGASALEVLSPAALIGVRTLAATPLLFLWASRAGGSLRVPRGEVPMLVGLAILGVSVNQLLFAEGISRAGPVHAAVLVVCIPVLTLLVAVLLGRERATRGRVVGIAIAVAGMAGVVRVERFDPSTDGAVGDLCLVASALVYAIYMVLVRPLVARRSAAVVIAWVFFFGALGALPWTAPAMAATDWTTVSAGTWATVGFIILGPTCGAYALNAYALRSIDASVVAVFIALQPFIGALSSRLLLGSEITLRTVVSGAVLIAGVLVASRPVRPAQPAS